MRGHGGNIWRAGKMYGIEPEKILDFSASINPLGPSPMAMEALEKALPLIRHYPEPQADSLRRELASCTGVPEEFLLLGNGAAELIYALGRVLQPTRVLLPVPTFHEYAGAFKDSPLVEVVLDEKDDFKIKLALLADRLRQRDLVILCNPNNPTGQLLLLKDLREFLQRVRDAGASLLLDEAFMDFVVPQHSLLPEVGKSSGLMVLRSLTKFFALPGLRLGYLAAEPEIIDRLAKQLPPWRVNYLAQVAASASLKDVSYMEKTLQIIRCQRDFLIEGLQRIPGLRPLRSAANFILVNCSATGCRASDIQAFLGPRGILLRTCSNFQGLGNGYFRLAVRSGEENRRLLTELAEFIKGTHRRTDP
ncbi:threonine-phosphate decarboxylase CobD [Desulforamulus ruminis]|uniref:threonine-phosphate decarboxylase n=1 Tax=Desulforamulus ruminis (strain ATCC 23193 / DSM 2154 / NCIMB 8452 / DL) TaxID=696281 RepID=F6DJX4_DESRL|nr:threonine-phosphate decarboxylase CobD [Desulforamulus ruminis]AEG59188.1 L-threonine-O-3-phosphate decarboxylase [Desulforamulus ruminis DSM 2154]